MNTYPRKAHFEYFSKMIDPTVGVTVKVDVQPLLSFCKAGDHPFYTAFIHLAALAANAVPELRQRIRGDRIVEYSYCGTSHIELLPDNSYCYCTLHHDSDWDEYFRTAQMIRAQAREKAGIGEDLDVEGLFFITTVPWLHYEHISMPVTGGTNSNPQICWGKYEKDGSGRFMMPLSIYANHALVDGIHIASFFENIRKELDALPPCQITTP